METTAGYISFDIGSKCLSLNGFADDNGVHILIWDCVGQDNQRWSIVNGDSVRSDCVLDFRRNTFMNESTLQGSSFQLQLKQTGKCLTAEGGGTYVDQWDCIGTSAAPHQSWTLDLIDSEPSTEDGGVIFARLRNYDFNTKCLHAVGGDNGAELELVDCVDENTDQQLTIDHFRVKDCICLQGLSISVLKFDRSLGYGVHTCLRSIRCEWKVPQLKRIFC